MRHLLLQAILALATIRISSGRALRQDIIDLAPDAHTNLTSQGKRLLFYEDGVCDQDRDNDPDCGGGNPSGACAVYAGVSMSRGYPGYCTYDMGCMAIQPLMIDQVCAEMFYTPPLCSESCYNIFAAIGTNCRWELLDYEYSTNQLQAEYGQPVYWVWWTLLHYCGLTNADGTPTNGSQTTGSTASDGGGFAGPELDLGYEAASDGGSNGTEYAWGFELNATAGLDPKFTVDDAATIEQELVTEGSSP